MTPADPSLPYSHEAESSVLSSMFHSASNRADAALDLKDEHFYHPVTRLLFQTFKQYAELGKPFEIPALMQHVMDLNLLEQIGGPTTLTDISYFNPTSDNYAYYRDILLQKEKLRSLIDKCDEGRKRAMDIGEEDALALAQSVQDSIGEILNQSESGKDEEFDDQLNTYVDVLEERILGRTETAIPSRWRQFNQTFGGITPTLWTIAAFPSTGKTALAQNVAEDVMANGGEVAWFSYEMSKTETIDRLVCAKSRVSSQKIFFPHLNPMDNREAAAVMQAIKSMKGQRLHLRCDPEITIEKLAVEVRRLKRKRPNLKLVIVDYLQLVPTKKNFNSRSEQVAYISRMLKRIQGAHEICCLMLSQLNDDGKTLDSRAPVQDSGVIITIEPERQVTDKRQKTTIYPSGIRVEKNRNLGNVGKLLSVRLNGQFFTFEEYAPDVVKQ